MLILEAQIPIIAPVEAKTRNLFGPVYHGTTPDNLANIREKGFISFNIDAINTYPKEPYGHTGLIPPLHHLGFGIYFTPSKAIARQFASGNIKGVGTFYLDIQNYEEINFVSPDKMMNWWIQHGYDPHNENRWGACYEMTKQIMSEFDAVYFKGKAFRGYALDGPQICVYDERKIYIVNNRLAKGLEIGAKVVNIETNQKGRIISFRNLQEHMLQFHPPGTTTFYVVKWDKGKTDYNVSNLMIQPLL